MACLVRPSPKPNDPDCFLGSLGTTLPAGGSDQLQPSSFGKLLGFWRELYPPRHGEGALVVPVVFDNSTDLVVAQAPDDFPDEAVEATLQQLAGNIHRGGYNGSEVHVRLRRLESVGEGVSQPVILGEVIRDLRQNITLPLAEKSDAG